MKIAASLYLLGRGLIAPIVFAMVFTAPAAHAVTNPDATDYVAKFKARANMYSANLHWQTRNANSTASSGKFGMLAKR